MSIVVDTSCAITPLPHTSSPHRVCLFILCSLTYNTDKHRWYILSEWPPLPSPQTADYHKTWSGTPARHRAGCAPSRRLGEPSASWRCRGGRSPPWWPPDRRRWCCCGARPDTPLLASPASCGRSRRRTDTAWYGSPHGGRRPAWWPPGSRRAGVASRCSGAPTRRPTASSRCRRRLCRRCQACAWRSARYSPGTWRRPCARRRLVTPGIGSGCPPPSPPRQSWAQCRTSRASPAGHRTGLSQRRRVGGWEQPLPDGRRRSWCCPHAVVSRGSRSLLLRLLHSGGIAANLSYA